MPSGEAAFLAVPACNSLRLGANVSQIIPVARDRREVSCIPFTSWSIFLLASSMTAVQAAANPVTASGA
jgi:hypothetical protein